MRLDSYGRPVKHGYCEVLSSGIYFTTPQKAEAAGCTKAGIVISSFLWLSGYAAPAWMALASPHRPAGMRAAHQGHLNSIDFNFT